MNQVSNKQSSILQLIEREFAKFRIENPGKKIGYPAKLKKLIGSNKARALSTLELAGAGNITPKSVRNWQIALKNKPKNKPTPLKSTPQNSRHLNSNQLKPKQLKVIENYTAQEQLVNRSEVQRAVRINFNNGVVIEIFAADLSTSLLSTLCGLEARQC